MEKGLFHGLYRQLHDLDVRTLPHPALSGILHGYLSVYSMVRVYPWLEQEFDSAYDIHERIREIARAIEPLAGNKELAADIRAGHVVDLMDAYQLYSDLSFLNTALDAAYDILTPWGSNKVVLPCHTPNVCRLLCNCYYFTGDTENGILAGKLVTEALGFTRKADRGELVEWWNTICLYEDVVGAVELPREEIEHLREERIRLRVSVEQVEDEEIEHFRQLKDGSDICLLAEIFDVLARREFSACNESYK